MISLAISAHKLTFTQITRRTSHIIRSLLTHTHGRRAEPPNHYSRRVYLGGSSSSPAPLESTNIEALCAAPQEALAYSPSQMQLSCPVAPASQRELHKAQRRRRRQRWWCGEEGARRPVPEGQVLHQVLLYVLRSVLRHVLHRVLHVLVLHVSPKGRPRTSNAKARDWTT